ncbi:MAG: hypothetical protein HY820_37485 [Acidobacteria bacterium]|nr:hypothetical protein [Acidobacteriota bacterium]
MKRIIMLLALSVSTLAVTLLSAYTPLVRVTLVQPTIVGETVLPPGDYSIQISRTTGDIPLLIFQGKEKSVMALANQIDSVTAKPSSAELILSKTGDQFKLTKVIIEGQAFELVR